MAGELTANGRTRRGRMTRATAAAVIAVAGGLMGGGLLPGAINRAQSADACQWPMYQHDATRTAVADACPLRAITPSNVAALAPKWFVPTLAAVTASPTVVDGTLYVGDGSGKFYALDAATGKSKWTAPFNVRNNTTHIDRHSISYGWIVSSAAYGINPENGRPNLYVGGGGTVYAIDAATGAAAWAQDTDPERPTSPAEVESSPLLYQPPGVNSRLQVIVGNDVNEASGQNTNGLMAFDAGTGALLWKFNPETKEVLHDLNDVTNNRHGYACGDVWGSATLDAANGILIFATGNCPNPQLAQSHGVPVVSEAAWAVNASNGSFKWVFSQGSTEAGATYGGDTDIGPTPMISPVAQANGDTTVLVPTKAGYIFALDTKTGTRVWATQAAQPGQSGSFNGAIGGFIGSGAVGGAGTATNAPKTIYAASAIWTPFKGEGPTSAGAQPDDTMANDPARVASLHAIDAADGSIKWHQPLAAPTYAPVTYANGVVFAPSTTTLSAAAYDAASGLQLWRAPAGGAPSSGVAIVGPNVFFGAGTSESAEAPTAIPPQPCGIWGYGIPTQLP